MIVLQEVNYVWRFKKMNGGENNLGMFLKKKLQSPALTLQSKYFGKFRLF